MAQNQDDSSKSKIFSRRALFLAGGQALLFSTLAGRMYYLQILKSDTYKTLAEDNRINLRVLPPPRGRILDRFGVELAVNEQNYRLVLVREQTLDVEATLDSLSHVISLSEHDFKRVLREVKRKRAFVPVTVRDNLSWEEVSKISVNAADLPGASIEVGQTRSYPYGPALAHTLGYVAAVSERDLTGEPLLELPGFRIGKNGLEKQHDLVLRGKQGNSHLEVNAYGRVIRELSRDEGEPGRDAVLTIDAGLQTYVQQRMMSQKSAAAVVLDIKNGDVLSLGSVPSYDPSAFNRGLSTREWNSLIKDHLSPLTNKAIAGTFAPGSTFKMIVALAAMKEGIGPQHSVFCPGSMRLGNAKFHCWKRGGHGWVDLNGSIQHSCDVYFYDIARRIGVDKIAAMANRFGLGQPVGVDLPGEHSGVVPTKAWKRANVGEPWQGGETLIAAIGQGFVLSTPLQLATMTARIASGGLKVTPRLTRGFNDEAGGIAEPDPQFESIGIPPEHLRVIHNAMDAVTNNRRGTAYKARIKEEGWEMAGKTGTSQVRRITLAERAAGVFKNEDLPWRRRDHALFVGYAPVHNPRYACAVIVEHGGGGSSTAAPIVRDILTETQRRDPSGAPAFLLRAPTPGQET